MGRVIGGQSAEEVKMKGQWGIDGRSVKIDSRANLNMTLFSMYVPSSTRNGSRSLSV